MYCCEDISLNNFLEMESTYIPKMEPSVRLIFYLYISSSGKKRTSVYTWSQRKKLWQLEMYYYHITPPSSNSRVKRKRLKEEEEEEDEPFTFDWVYGDLEGPFDHFRDISHLSPFSLIGFGTLYLKSKLYRNGEEDLACPRPIVLPSVYQLLRQRMIMNFHG